MLLFNKENLVFLSTPKTGTTALEAALLPHCSAAILDPPGLKHLSLSRYRGPWSKLFEAKSPRPFETVAVMREPVDWLFSWYRYRARPQIAGKPNSTQGISFDDFVRAWLQKDQPPFAQVGSQARFLAGPAGGVGVDHVFRHDRFEGVVAFFEARLGVSLVVERRNVSPQATAPLHLSDETRAALHDQAGEEFAAWEAVCARAP